MTAERDEQAKNELMIRVGEFDAKTTIADARLQEAVRALSTLGLSPEQLSAARIYGDARAYSARIDIDIAWIGALTKFGEAGGSLEDVLKIWNDREKTAREISDNRQS